MVDGAGFCCHSSFLMACRYCAQSLRISSSQQFQVKFLTQQPISSRVTPISFVTQTTKLSLISINCLFFAILSSWRCWYHFLRACFNVSNSSVMNGYAPRSRSSTAVMVLKYSLFLQLPVPEDDCLRCLTYQSSWGKVVEEVFLCVFSSILGEFITLEILLDFSMLAQNISQSQSRNPLIYSLVLYIHIQMSFLSLRVFLVWKQKAVLTATTLTSPTTARMTYLMLMVEVRSAAVALLFSCLVITSKILLFCFQSQSISLCRFSWSLLLGRQSKFTISRPLMISTLARRTLFSSLLERQNMQVPVVGAYLLTLSTTPSATFIRISSHRLPSLRITSMRQL